MTWNGKLVVVVSTIKDRDEYHHKLQNGNDNKKRFCRVIPRRILCSAKE